MVTLLKPIPNTTVEPFPGDETPRLREILKDVKTGCASHERSLTLAKELDDYYQGHSEKYVAFKPAEDALSWLTRPKRVSFVTRQAVHKLTDHLYKPGPRHRKLTISPAADAWYNRVCQDIQLNGVMRHADRLATLHGICAIGVYPTGNPSRPVNYHLFPRTDFVVWTNPDDPRVPVAICTITKIDHETVRFRLWTASHYYTFFKGKSWGYTPGGWNVAKFDPTSSGPHPYGVLPFKFVTHELPTTELETKGLGVLLSKINRALNIDKSNMANWVHHYGRPLGFVSGVGAEWRPKFIDGGFVVLPARYDTTESAPIIPQAHYLESNINIPAILAYVAGEANAALAELDIPLTIAVQSDGGGGAMAKSGLGIAALNADLITYAKGRQPLFEYHETQLAALVCQVGTTPIPGQLDGVDASLISDLQAVAADPQLRLSWGEVAIDLPGPDRDNADLFEIQMGLTDVIQVLMQRRGLSEEEAIDAYRGIQRRKLIAQTLEADPEAEIVVPEPDDDEIELPADGRDPFSAPAVDMGVPNITPELLADRTKTEISPNTTVTVVIDPKMDIPAAPLLLPSTPGFGAFGTEN